ncbi:serine-enriched protein-like [Littorina saxatilis]|uniref:serine-enriched protein-like n=1 Tax=Littorina saxatilis TaxID=31220 RepID=UPI0038B69AE5
MTGNDQHTTQYQLNPLYVYIFSGSEGGYSMEQDWDSCSNHSNATASSGASDDPRPPSPRQHSHQQHRHQQQQQHQQPALSGGEEVMFYNSTKALWDSLAYITSMPEMCDVIFHVGRTRQPVYGVKSLLSVRSRVMYLRILHAQRTSSAPQKKSWKKLRHFGNRDVTLNDGKVHIDVADYDATVFSQLIDFLHCGRVTVDVSTALGLFCAASEYQVQDLRTACWDFVERCAQRGHAHFLLTSGRSYLGRPCLEKLSRKFLKT